MKKPDLWPIVGVFAVTIVVTLMFWKVLPRQYSINESSDYKVVYEPVARSILHGHGFNMPDGTPAVRYPPGYPTLLALAFGFADFTNIPESLVLSALILLAMGSASVFVYLLAQSVWGRLPGLIAALIWIGYPFALWLTKQPNSEPSFFVFFYAAFYVFWSALLRKSGAWHSYFFSGFLLGLASLIRPIALGAVFITSAILLLQATQLKIRLRLLLVTLMLMGNFVAIFPWELSVYLKTGRVIPLSTGGLLTMREGLTYAVDLDGYRLASVPEDVSTLMKAIDSQPSESLHELFSVLFEYLKERPQVVAKLFMIKAARSWYGTDGGRSETAITLIQIVYLLFVSWATVVCCRQRGPARNLAIAVWLMVFYFWGMTIVGLSILRYMVPAMGLLMVLVPACFFRTESSTIKMGSKLSGRRSFLVHG